MTDVIHSDETDDTGVDYNLDVFDDKEDVTGCEVEFMIDSTGLTNEQLLNYNDVDYTNRGIRSETKVLPTLSTVGGVQDDLNSISKTEFDSQMLSIYNRVFHTKKYNFQEAKIPIPSGLKIDAWTEYLSDYHDKEIVQFLNYGWPSGFMHYAPLMSTLQNHQSGIQFPSHVESYINTEIGKKALLGPFVEPPVVPIHISPVMTRPKKDSDVRRIVVDLSWPRGYSVNDGIHKNEYLGSPINLKLPTVDYMADRVRALGEGCFMYKLDLSRGYRQLRLDPLDWPIMSIQHSKKWYMDMCPPFGLRTAAMMMERTTMAACYIHGLYGWLSKAYIDDFGGAEQDHLQATQAFETLQGVLHEVGLDVAPHKTCPPSDSMVWLGILVNSSEMTLSIPITKLEEVQVAVDKWGSRNIASRKQVQSILGLLNFVGSVAPAVRVYTNRILNFLRGMPMDGFVEIPLEVREDLEFFRVLMPEFNGISLLDKSMVPPDEQLEVDACLEACGGLSGDQYYSRRFPAFVLGERHTIAHLEMLNLVVSLRLWVSRWGGKKLQVFCDNQNTCVALQTGRSRDRFMQSCIRAVFLLSVKNDVEILVSHTPGTSLIAADALSRLHKGDRFRQILDHLGCLHEKVEVQIPDHMFEV